ncbi:MAG: PDZ domain-containing protein [Candidatus Omnitrophica bacterium]|nr:PDZ domain-containing protein [Candidatus Omnitrophota bacterium]
MSVTKNVLFLCLVLSCFCLISLTARICSGDTLKTTGGEVIDGVVTSETENDLLVETVDGTRSIVRADIASISRGTDNENLIRLADIEKKKGATAKAYYLYKSAFMLEPDLEGASRGISSVENEAHNAKTGDFSYQAEYENFSGNRTGKKSDDHSILDDNTVNSEALIDKFGLILDLVDNRVVVAEVSGYRDTRSARSGLRNSDFIIKVNGKLSLYMGLYGVVNELLAEGSTQLTLTVQREIAVWMPGGKQIVLGELEDIAGFSLLENDKGVFVGRVREASEVSSQGLQSGDKIIKMNGAPAGTRSADELASTLLKYGSGKFTIIVEKEIRL